MKRLFYALCLCFVFACAHAPRVLPPLPSIPEFEKEQSNRRQATRLLTGKVKVRFTGREASSSGRGGLISQLPGQVRMELRDPVGRLHYVVTVDGKDFAAHLPKGKVAYLDRRGGASYLKQVVGLPVSFQDLVALLYGLLPESVRLKTGSDWIWDEGHQSYRTRTEDSQGNPVLVWIDPNRNTLQALELTRQDLKFSLEYDDFAPCCTQASMGKIPLAQIVSVHAKAGASALEFEWQNLEVFDKARSVELFKPNLGTNTRIVTLE